jgi:D-alanyl-D-alanine carboxypeptidase
MTSKTRLGLTALAVGVAALAVAGTAQADVAKSSRGAPASAAKLEREAERLVALGAPGVIVYARDRNRVVRFARGYGRLAPRVPMRVSDRWRTASLTKTYTAVVVLQLAGEGRLSLDDTVERWLPGLVPGGAAITVRQLLNHTSGLFDYFEDPALVKRVVRNPTRAWTPQELIAIGTSHGPLFAPGTNSSYSNTGYQLLGLIVEAATGNTIGSELGRRIFEPLRLRDTTFDTQPRIAGRHAHGYLRLGGPSLTDFTVLSPTIAGAGGAIVSTVDDVARFYRALLSGRLLRADLLGTMTTIDPAARRAGYGLGLIRDAEHYPCAVAWGHDGDLPGYLTAANVSRGGRRQMVVIVNTDSLSRRARPQLNRLLIAAYCVR